jgi:NitT/TauT family transport system substrate-binding protein
MKQFAFTNMDRLSRRDFLKVTAGLGLSAAGMALLEACGIKPAAPTTITDELETTTVRLTQAPPTVCLAPQYLAEDLLRQDGFTDIQYVKAEGGTSDIRLATGDADICMLFVVPGIIRLEAGAPFTILAGVQIGCFELFATEQIGAIRDLKGKTIPVSALDGAQYFFLATMLTYVGLDPNKDINWVVQPPAEAIQLLTEGKVDAFLAFPPTAQELRAKKIGHVVLNSMMDDPWSQYFCCTVGARREFMQKNPVATKRVLSAILQGSDICAREPERAARFIVDKGYTTNYDYAVESMKEIPYNKWREYDPEDTVRFYALRLHEAGLLKSSPEEIIKQGTDWRLLNELKMELKG